MCTARVTNKRSCSTTVEHIPRGAIDSTHRLIKPVRHYDRRMSVHGFLRIKLYATLPVSHTSSRHNKDTNSGTRSSKQLRNENQGTGATTGIRALCVHAYITGYRQTHKHCNRKPFFQRLITSIYRKGHTIGGCFDCFWHGFFQIRPLRRTMRERYIRSTYRAQSRGLS